MYVATYSARMHAGERVNSIIISLSITIIYYNADNHGMNFNCTSVAIDQAVSLVNKTLGT